MRATLLLAVVALVGMTLAGCLKDHEDEERPNFIRIHSIDVAAPHVTTGTVTLAVNASLDNRAASSDPVKLVVKAFNTATGLLARTATADVGTIEADKTRAVEVELSVPRAAGYRIEVQVHEDGQHVQTGTVVVHNVQALEPTIHETGLKVSTIDFLVRNATAESGRVEIEATVYVTNEGTGAATSLRMQVKAREVTTSLVADETWTDVAGVGVDETVAFPVRLTVPARNNYEVQVVLWDDDFIVERGSGNVQLLPTFTKKNDTDIVVSEPRLEDFVRNERGAAEAGVGRGLYDEYDEALYEGDTANTPGPGVLVALAVVAAAAVAMARGHKRRERS